MTATGPAAGGADRRHRRAVRRPGVVLVPARTGSITGIGASPAYWSFPSPAANCGRDRPTRRDRLRRGRTHSRVREVAAASIGYVGPVSMDLRLDPDSDRVYVLDGDPDWGRVSGRRHDRRGGDVAHGRRTWIDRAAGPGRPAARRYPLSGPRTTTGPSAARTHGPLCGVAGQRRRGPTNGPGRPPPTCVRSGNDLRSIAGPLDSLRTRTKAPSTGSTPLNEREVRV